jgi:predicted Fe-S protein YdhL (DUF1289 family)
MIEPTQQVPECHLQSTGVEYPWHVEPHELRFTFGELQLYCWEFPALVLERHRTELPSELASIKLPLADLSANAEAAVIPCFDGGALARVGFCGGCVRYLPERVSHHWIELDGSYQAFVQRLRQKVRHELRRKQTRLSKHLQQRLVFRVYREPEQMEAFRLLALQVSAKTYQERLLHAGLPRTEAFRQRLGTMSRSGRFRGYLLLDGERPIAYGYCEVQGSVLLYVYTGYDPEYRQWSPGIVLLGRILESVFEEGRFRLLDLDWGDAQWKQDFATHTVRGGRVLFFRGTLRNLAMVLAHSLTKATSDRAAKLLGFLEIKPVFKRFLRARVGCSEYSAPVAGDDG